MFNTHTGSDWDKLFDKLPAQIKGNFITHVFGKGNDKDKKINDILENVFKDDKLKIFVGAGTCGIAAGADKVIQKIKDFMVKNNLNAELIEVGCIGLCSSEPIIDIKVPGMTRVSYQNVTADDVDDILNDAVKGKINSGKDLIGQFPDKTGKSWDKIPMFLDNKFFAKQKRFVLENCGIIDPVNIRESIKAGAYSAFLKAIHTMTPEEVCSVIEESGLRGRGGGGFPAGKKWKMALKQEGKQKYVICNADEGDPGAFMDRAVIEGDPHRVIEGLAIAAYGIKAETAYVYIRAEYPLAIERLINAIEEAKKIGMLGNNIYDSGFNFDIIIKKGAGAFVCGEETALIHSIEGKRGMPRPRPPYPAAEGLFNKPTIINNVETIANVPIIIRNGSAWFAGFGTKGSKGTKVFALSGKVKRTGLVEVEMGTPLKEIIFTIGNGIIDDNKFKAVQIGGPSGGCIPEQHLGILIDYESLKEVGAMMGSGGLVVMDEKNCMVDVAKFFMDFIQRESCGKCIPCREGTRRMYEILNDITQHRRNDKKNDALKRFQGIIQLEKLAKVIKDASLCGLGKTAANPILSTLRWFRHEYEEHLYDRKCPTKACKEMLTYSINNKKCTGCTACARKCPTSAILGEKKSPHYIVAEKCIGCGNCVDTCKFDAIAVQ